MPTFTQQISDTSNDVRAFNGALTTSTTNQGYGNSGLPINAGFRFTSIAVPQGATIVSASLTTVLQSLSGAPSATQLGQWYGDKVADAPAWSSTSRPDQITPTTASTPIILGTTGQTLVHDITAIVQELVDQPSYALNNDMRFAGLGQSGGGGATHYQQYYDFGTSATNAATLSITYTTTTDYAQTITATAALSPSISRTAGRLVSASLTSAVSIGRSLGKAVSTSFTGSVSIGAGKHFMVAVSASFSAAVAIVTAVGHLVFQTVEASFSSVASIATRLRANVTIAATVAPRVTISAGKAFQRIITASSSFSAVVGRSYAVTVSAAVSLFASLFSVLRLAPPPSRLLRLSAENRIIELPAENRIMDL